MKNSTHQSKIDIIELVSLLLGALVLLLFAVLIGKGQSRIQEVRPGAASTQNQQQLYREYRGVRLGMTSIEVRTRLGEPAMKSDDQDFYVVSAKETAQIVYDAGQKVVTISTDYTGGVGAPDYKAVVGEELLQRPDGSLFKIVFYNSAGFWVSYNKSGSDVPVVTVTIGTVK
ncbi:MAG TPA: hypothetical protein VLB68_09495 [Pyrinomonadaceae bacterium]|nr:hypothetical protein [Pyrinomonadaceae bacterium]